MKGLGRWTFIVQYGVVLEFDIADAAQLTGLLQRLRDHYGAVLAVVPELA